jgi:hypothetical protein
MTEDLLNSIESDADYYDLLVGEGKKFKSEKDLAKGKFVADNYILTLERQLDQLREDYEKVKEEKVAKVKLQELIDQMDRRPEPTRDTTPVEKPKPTIDPSQIEDLIDTRISQRERARKEADNYNLVKAKLEEKLGKNYQEVLQERISELDISPEQLNSMAKNNPKTVFRLLELDTVEAPSTDIFRAPPRPSQVTTSLQPTAEKRTWSWYQKLKLENPKEYYNPKTNVQMHNDALRYGEAFEDGDFNAHRKDYRIKY